MTISTNANENFEKHIQQNSYPGRGLVIGRTEAGNWAIVYWIMGRSPNSRNRRFAADGAALRTEPIDSSNIEKPELIIYEAMLELPGIYLAGNGDQTRTLYETLQAGGLLAAGGAFDAALLAREREPDAPNYTPRISGMITPNNAVNSVTMSILKANPADPALTDRFTYRPASPPPGFGYCLTTYMGDGSPLPSFAGDPLWLPLQGSQEDILQSYWDGLDVDNRVALAVKIVRDDGRSRILIRNQS
ncbi:MAG: inosine monophosphate cyclohydrolase [Chloroflexi bacterium]|nr:inosine monophosphate cyclohydrolase [Chloroflexota bacterium]